MVSIAFEPALDITILSHYSNLLCSLSHVLFLSSEDSLQIIIFPFLAYLRRKPHSPQIYSIKMMAIGTL